MSKRIKLPCGKTVINGQTMLGCLNDFYSVDLEKSLINPWGIVAALRLEPNLKLYLPEDAILYQVDEWYNGDIYGFVSPYNAMRLIECAESKYSRPLRDFILNRVIPFMRANKIHIDILPKSETQATTMSSLEIAELTGKQHAHIMRDIRNMVEQLEKGKLANPKLDWLANSSAYTDKQGKKRECYLLDYNTTINLLTGYDAAKRMSVIQRWQELESGKPALPQITPPAIEQKTTDRPQATNVLNASAIKLAVSQIDQMRLPPDSKQVLKAKLLNQQFGLPLELMLPVTYEEKLSPAQIAEQLKVSPQAIGRIITKLGIRGNEDYCEGRLSQSSSSSKEVVMYF